MTTKTVLAKDAGLSVDEWTRGFSGHRNCATCGKAWPFGTLRCCRCGGRLYPFGVSVVAILHTVTAIQPIVSFSFLAWISYMFGTLKPASEISGWNFTAVGFGMVAFSCIPVFLIYVVRPLLAGKFWAAIVVTIHSGVSLIGWSANGLFISLSKDEVIRLCVPWITAVVLLHASILLILWDSDTSRFFRRRVLIKRSIGTEVESEDLQVATSQTALTAPSAERRCPQCQNAFTVESDCFASDLACPHCDAIVQLGPRVAGQLESARPSSASSQFRLGAATLGLAVLALAAILFLMTPQKPEDPTDSAIVGSLRPGSTAPPTQRTGERVTRPQPALNPPTRANRPAPDKQPIPQPAQPDAILGPAKVEIRKFTTAVPRALYGRRLNQEPNRKFVFMDLRVTELAPNQRLDTDRLYLLDENGKAFGPPRVYGLAGNHSAGRTSEANRSLVAGPGDLSVYFSVDKSSPLNSLRLRYRR